MCTGAGFCESVAGAHGRWSVVPRSSTLSVTEWSANISQQLLNRYGIVLRETALAESIPGGYSTLYPDLDFLVAAAVLSRVISKPGRNRLCLDLGHKAVAADPVDAPRVIWTDDYGSLWQVLKF